MFNIFFDRKFLICFFDRKFNRKSKYPANSECTWSLHVGENDYAITITKKNNNKIKNNNNNDKDDKHLSQLLLGLSKNALSKYETSFRNNDDNDGANDNDHWFDAI